MASLENVRPTPRMLQIVYPSSSDDGMDLSSAMNPQDRDLAVFAELGWRVSMLLYLVVDLSTC